jgi:uncharacterized protein YdaU (DUF1376 family)
VTFVGKILTALTLVLSILFAGLAVVVFATHKNWRESAQTLEKDLGALKAANQRLTEDITQYQGRLAREQMARKVEVAALETELLQAVQQLTVARQTADKAASDLGVLVGQSKDSTAMLSSLTNETTMLRTQLRDAQGDRDQQFVRNEALVDENHSLQGTLADQKVRNAALAAANARYQRLMADNGIDEGAPLSPPSVDGYVMAVEKDLIEISLGADDGMKVGYSLDVYRGSTYLGRVVVKVTQPDRSVAEVLPEFRKGLIRTSDRVATRFVN